MRKRTSGLLLERCDHAAVARFSTPRVTRLTFALKTQWPHWNLIFVQLGIIIPAENYLLYGIHVELGVFGAGVATPPVVTQQ